MLAAPPPPAAALERLHRLGVALTGGVTTVVAMRFVQHHFPHFDAIEILMMAGGVLIIVTLAFAM
jgi:hypothetical protein